MHATDKVFTISSASEGDSGIYEYVMTKHWTEYFYIKFNIVQLYSSIAHQLM